MQYKKLDDIPAYQISSNLGDYVWEIVTKWEWFPKSTVGEQFVRAADSIAANFAEGSVATTSASRLDSSTTHELRRLKQHTGARKLLRGNYSQGINTTT